MKKITIVGTLLITASLFVGGIYFPDAPLMWLASTSIWFELLRAAMMAALVTLLIVEPPRPKTLRYAIGGIAAGLFAITIALSQYYIIQPIDTMVLIEVALVLGIEALEDLPHRAATRKRIIVKQA